MQKRGKTAVVGVLVSAAAVALVACGNNSSSAPSSSTESAPALGWSNRECTADDVKVTGAFGRPPTITIPDNCSAPTKLIVKDLSVGTGPAATDGSHLDTNYALVTWSNKQKADSSFDRGQTFGLTLGEGQVIPGWDKGLVGIKKGGRRLLIVPSDLGYGAAGQPPTIAPNETLVFVTDAVNVGGAN